MASGAKTKTANKKTAGKKSTGAKRSSSAASSSKKSSAARRKETLAKQQKKREIRNDLILLFAMVITILLFLALFDRIGALGRVLAAFEFGIFGSLAYVFAFFILLAAIYLIYRSEAYPLHSWGRVLLAFVMLTLLAGMFELSGSKGSLLSSLGAYYRQGKVLRLSGGFFGGFWCRLLVPALGKVGAWIVCIALFLGCLMLILGRAIFTGLGRRGGKVVNTIKEESTRYKSAAEDRRLKAQLRVEERERARAEERAARAKAENEERQAVLAKIAAQQEARRKAEEASAKAQPVRLNEVRTKEPKPLLRGQQESMLKAQAEERARAQMKADADRKYAEKSSGWQQGSFTDDSPLVSASPLNELMQEMDQASGVKKETRTIREIERLDEKKSAPGTQRELYSDDVVMSGRDHMLASDYKATGRPTQSYGNRAAAAVAGEVLAKETAEAERAGGKTLAGAAAGSGAVKAARPDLRIRYSQPDAGTAFGESEILEREAAAASASAGKLPSASAGRSIVATGREEAEEVFEDPREVVARLSETGKNTVATSADSIWNTNKERSGSGSATFTESGKAAEPAAAPANRPSTRTSAPGKSGEKSAAESSASATLPASPAPKKEYKLPPVSLLSRGKSSGGMKESDLRRTAKVLEDTLAEFGVAATVTDVSCGPSVTRYELKPEQGVRVSRIASLSDDIKLALAATEIRIEAPIPGKSAVGIEVPNSENQTVYLRTLIESEELAKMHSKIAFAVGQDIGGAMVVADLAKMPHLLIAGATGSGKSVCINSLILSLLYRTKPDEVQMIMIDPKVVELSVYNGIPHLRIPVVTDAKLAADALNGAVKEMTRRYKLFADLNVRDIKGYNTKIRENPEEYEGQEILPQIVIIVDEFADLMMVSKQDVEQSVCRLAQLARAAGIHLVLATQRPSVDVITGLIKANIQSRIALAVSSGVDSRTIIDMNGAEKLLGKGDMLFYPTGYPKPVRVQGCWVSDDEVAAVRDFWAKQCSISDEDMAKQNRSWMNDPVEREHPVEDERDELFIKAADYIIDSEKASIGNLQRIFRIGFNRAARLMDQLADAGIVGKDNGTKSRDIMMDKVQFADWKHENGYE